MRADGNLIRTLSPSLITIRGSGGAVAIGVGAGAAEVDASMLVQV